MRARVLRSKESPKVRPRSRGTRRLSRISGAFRAVLQLLCISSSVRPQESEGSYRQTTGESGKRLHLSHSLCAPCAPLCIFLPEPTKMAHEILFSGACSAHLRRVSRGDASRDKKKNGGKCGLPAGGQGGTVGLVRATRVPYAGMDRVGVLARSLCLGITKDAEV